MSVNQIELDLGTIISNTNGGYTITGAGTGNYSLNYDQNWHSNSLYVKGNAVFEQEANFEGDVKFKGKSLSQSLEKIEEKLAILHPNPELEKKWEELRNLRKQYMDLEKEILEKEQVWNILQK
jgi:hypothetical protein